MVKVVCNSLNIHDLRFLNMNGKTTLREVLRCYIVFSTAAVLYAFTKSIWVFKINFYLNKNQLVIFRLHA